MTLALLMFLVPVLFLLCSFSFLVGILWENLRESSLGRPTLSETELNIALLIFGLTLCGILYYTSAPVPEHDFDAQAVYQFELFVTASFAMYFWMGQLLHRDIKRNRTEP